MAYAAREMAEEDKLTINLGLRVTAEDLERIDALADKVPVASRHSVARHAMRMGLALLEEDPQRFLAAPETKTTKRKK